MSGSTCAATEKPSRANIPDEYRFTGVSMNSANPENSTIWSNLPRISARDIPKIVPFR
jgi:hypothetical protein